jgi:hypothetical protein
MEVREGTSELGIDGTRKQGEAAIIVAEGGIYVYVLGVY